MKKMIRGRQGLKRTILPGLGVGGNDRWGRELIVLWHEEQFGAGVGSGGHGVGLAQRGSDGDPSRQDRVDTAQRDL